MTSNVVFFSIGAQVGAIWILVSPSGYTSPVCGELIRKKKELFIGRACQKPLRVCQKPLFVLFGMHMSSAEPHPLGEPFKKHQKSLLITAKQACSVLLGKLTQYR